MGSCFSFFCRIFSGVFSFLGGDTPGPEFRGNLRERGPRSPANRARGFDSPLGAHARRRGGRARVHPGAGRSDPRGGGHTLGRAARPQAARAAAFRRAHGAGRRPEKAAFSHIRKRVFRPLFFVGSELFLPENLVLFIGLLFRPRRAMNVSRAGKGEDRRPGAAAAGGKSRRAQGRKPREKPDFRHRD